jgi:hypothetical protein
VDLRRPVNTPNKFRATRRTGHVRLCTYTFYHLCYTPHMIPQLDIFRVGTDGHLLWIAAAGSLQGAQRRITILMTSEPADYVIYSQQTGDKTVVCRKRDPAP